jgi:3-dehydroquinate synthase
LLIHKFIINTPRFMPYNPEQTRFIWTHGLFEPLSQNERSLSVHLFGDESVMAVLRVAFSRKLTREMVWDISDIEPKAQSSYVKAAKVYKRGVGVVGVVGVDHAQSDCLESTIKFFSDIRDVFSSFDSGDLIFVDRKVAEFWWHVIPFHFLTLDISEAGKNLESSAAIAAILRSRKGTYHNVVVVGGGVACDVVGFVCGLIDVPCHFVPTTLLAMVDSSTGGKVGVNFEPWGKNQLGLFYPPASVSICAAWLATLDEANLKSGAAEALKHAAISGQRRLWERLIEVVKNKNWYGLHETIAEVLRIKIAIVTRDPFEQGERSILNFGHTLGHAVESLLVARGRDVSHGACIALGMIHVFAVASGRYGFDATHLIEDVLSAGLLPGEIELRELIEVPKDEILTLMQSDKKNQDPTGAIRFVLLEDWGKPARDATKAWTVRIPVDEVLHHVEHTFTLINQYLLQASERRDRAEG